jgi:hypothetical protein
MPSPKSTDLRTPEHAGRWERFPQDADIGVRGVGDTPAAEIKGATYTRLRVAQGADGTRIAECVVDAAEGAGIARKATGRRTS